MSKLALLLSTPHSPFALRTFAPSPPISPQVYVSVHHPQLHLPDEPPQSLKTPTIRTRLSQLCREGQPHIARQLFDTLPRPTTVLWNSIIIGFICNKLSSEALLFYARMRYTSFTKCDSYTYSSILKACADTMQLDFGKAVHCHLLRSNIYASKIVYNSLLSMYSTCMGEDDSTRDAASVDLVRRVFDSMKKRDVVAWNITISWYVKTQRFREAVMQFRRMLRMGIKPTPVSFVNVFPAVSGLDNLDIGNSLYGLLVKFGDEYVNDVFAVSSAISMYSQMGYVDLARRVFDACLEKNVEVWNTMISGYVQNGCFVQALLLFVDALQSQQPIVDGVSLLAALTAASQLHQLSIGQQLHAFVIKNALPLSVTVLNAVVVMYSRFNLIGESFKVFNEMGERDTVSWNTMVTALVQNGMDEEGLMLVREMQKQGFLVDSVTATAIFSASSNLKSGRIGKQTHAYLLRQGIQFEGMNSYLIEMYSRCGLIQIAQVLFERSDIQSRDLATWNSMISSNTQNGRGGEALVVLGQMLEENVIPNSVTLASVLPSCTQTGNVSFGKQIHGYAMRHCLEENVFVSTALVDMYSKCGLIAAAENVFSWAHEKNLVSYTNMILGYAQHGMGAEALSLFNLMKELDVKPDSVTLVAVLSACGHSGLVDEGLMIFESMEREYGIEPSTEHYSCVVDMLGRVGRLVEAFELAREMNEDYNAVRAWGSLLSSCKNHGQFELAKIAANTLLELESGTMSGYNVLLSNIHADEGKWEDVDRIRVEMQQRGLRKEVACSWIEVGGSVSRFTSKDKNYQEGEAIHRMLHFLAAEMKRSGSERTFGFGSDYHSGFKSVQRMPPCE